MTLFKAIITFLGITLVSSISIQANSQTLPKGVWSFNLWHVDQEIDKVAIQDRDGSVKFVKARDYTADKVPALDPLIQYFGFDPTTQLAKKLEINSTYFQIAYGITPKLLVYAETVYLNTVLTYADGYINEMEKLDPNRTNDDIDIPPAKAYGRGWGDSAMGIKYRYSDNSAFALSATAGFLKTGTDGKDKAKARDGFETLETGERYDRYTLAFFHNFNMTKKYRLELTSGFVYHAPGGWEEMLGNSFEYDAGDEVFLVLNNHFFPAQKHEFNFSYTFDATGTDKMKTNGGTAEAIKDSSSESHYFTLGYRYKPFIFLHLWTDYTLTAAMEPALGIYDVGRMFPSGTLRFGVNLFLK